MSEQKSSTIKTKDGRTRNFATVVYPESAPENWQELLSEQFVPAFISPIHDKDVNPTNEPKKAHYHVMIMFDNKKTMEQAKELVASFGGVGCEVVNSLRGYARYLCHMDNPEKFQYNPDDVRSLCGADYTNAIGLVTDKYKAIREMLQFCMDEGIISLADLIEYCMGERPDWFRVICDNTIIMREYLKSKEWTIRTRSGIKCDPETGEVLNDENNKTNS